jgi:hypothetical protein
MQWALAAGTLFRLAAYAANRGYWLDEASLAGNLRSGSPFAIFAPLTSSQLVPPGFLILGRALAQSLGDSPWILRLLPLVSGLAALFLFAHLARHILTGWTATLAVALVAVSDELIYYATELKPYSTDVAAAVAVGCAAIHLKNNPLTMPRWIAWACLGSALIWLSFPAAFVLAVAGLVVAHPALVARDWRKLAALTLAPLLWLFSFAVVIASARAQLAGHPGLWRFWDFAFPPPLTSDAAWIPRRLLFLFVSPGDYHGPFDPRLSALPAIALAVIGAVSLAQRSPAALWLAAGPAIPALVAAALRCYPFHGRCLLFLLPGLFLLIAEGAGWIAKRVPGLASRVILALLLLAYPLALDLYHIAEPRQRTGLNPHGDRRPYDLAPDIFQLSSSS